MVEAMEEEEEVGEVDMTTKCQILVAVFALSTGLAPNSRFSRKNFYVEDKKVSQRSEREIEDFKKSKENQGSVRIDFTLRTRLTHGCPPGARSWSAEACLII